MKSSLSRRQAIAFTSAGLICANKVFAEKVSTATCTLGFGTYGLPKSTTEEAIDRVAAAGYDSIELYVLADRDLDAGKVSAARRKDLRKRISDSGLKLTSLMENLRPAEGIERHKSDLLRLQHACELSRDLSPDDPPPVQTVLGGKDWDAFRDICAKRLEDWAEIAAKTDVTVAIKPHRGGAMSRPEDAAWLLKKLGSPKRMQMWFDYSHFAFRDLSIESMVKQSLPITAGIAVKDAVQQGKKVSFDLPGAAGTIDYSKLLSLFFEGGYRRDVCVEVSSAVWRNPSYDSQAALDDSYRNLSAAFKNAGINRPSR